MSEDSGGLKAHLMRSLGIVAFLSFVIFITRTGRGFIYWFIMSLPWIFLFLDRSGDPFVMRGTLHSWFWTMVFVGGIIYFLGLMGWGMEGAATAVIWWLPMLLYPLGIMLFGHTIILSDGTDGRPKTYRHMSWDCSAQLANRADHGTVYNRDGSYQGCSYKIYYDNDPKDSADANAGFYIK